MNIILFMCLNKDTADAVDVSFRAVNVTSLYREHEVTVVTTEIVTFSSHKRQQ